ncbi:MAG: hypothetical protein P4L49_16370 [Desulfosporosinus sp.]|nr:hypothetical protein [Desulfosporosinus sp.]
MHEESYTIVIHRIRRNGITLSMTLENVRQIIRRWEMVGLLQTGFSVISG